MWSPLDTTTTVIWSKIVDWWSIYCLFICLYCLTSTALPKVVIYHYSVHVNIVTSRLNWNQARGQGIKAFKTVITKEIVYSMYETVAIPRTRC